MTPEQVAEARTLAASGKEAHWLAFEIVPALCDKVDELTRQNGELLAGLKGAPHQDDCASSYSRCPDCGSGVENCRCSGHYQGTTVVQNPCDCWKSALISKYGGAQ